MERHVLFERVIEVMESVAGIRRVMQTKPSAVQDQERVRAKVMVAGVEESVAPARQSVSLIEPFVTVDRRAAPR